MALSEHDEWLANEAARRAAKNRANHPVSIGRSQKPSSRKTRGNGSGLNTAHRDFIDDQQDID